MTILSSAYLPLVAVLGVAGLGKVRDLPAFARSVEGYRVVPPRLTRPVARLVVATELVAAVLLALPPARLWGALLACWLFAAFLAGMAGALRQGLQVDCGCFGTSRTEDTVGPGSVTRTGLLLALSVAAVIAGPTEFRPAQLLIGGLLLATVLVLAELVAVFANTSGRA
jgi:hypothetical protein